MNAADVMVSNVITVGPGDREVAGYPAKEQDHS